MRTILLLLLLLATPVHAGQWIEEQFFLSDADLSGTTYYLGYRTTESGWYIKAMDTTNTDQFRVSYSYVEGNTDYSHHWVNRASLSGASRYQVFDDAF